MKYPALLSALLLALPACLSSPPAEETLFTLLPPDATGITFRNDLEEREGLNVLAYEYFYNGGGVAVGDVDGDDLPDVYFTANMGPNRLYRNRGGFRFEDVTERAGVAGTPGWTTGVAMADVNGDGHLDLYVLKSGRVRERLRRNELYINEGDGTFSERAAEYGLDDPSTSTHATFFDYDRDGDLDLFLLNHPTERLSRFNVTLIKARRDPLAGDKLYRNDADASGSGRRFTDVSEEAGILGNPLGYGLSAAAGDVDGDGWTDLYVANDYVEDDYLYINNGDGTFSERLRDFVAHTSYSSMGSDLADFNNDARPDLLVLDMLAEDNRRQKLLKGPEGYDYYAMLARQGYHQQYVRNTLQLNNGNGTFSEIGQLAGVSNTDWSWAALFADFDLDGWKDLFITNGYRRDYTNLDFLEGDLIPALGEARARGEEPDLFGLVQRMPSTPLPNYAFRNAGDLTFEDRTEAWGLDQRGLSNGAAYADLDRDGDLDLVVNNMDEEAFVYRNNAERAEGRHYLRVRLAGAGANRFGVGAKVTLTTGDGRTFYQELVPSRGYLSSVEPALLFGLGDAARVDVDVAWPDGTRQRLSDVAADTTLVLRQADARPGTPPEREAPAHGFVRLPDGRGLGFAHRENYYVDFEREPLLPHLLSRLGPALAHGDVNGDGLPDVFVGGATGQAAALFLQQADGSFREVDVEAFTAHRPYEDVDALFFDADGDGDLDLYVVSGGATGGEEGVAYQDRLYVNGGFGGFSHAREALPPIGSSGGAVAAHDYDGDGDLDLFVGGRVRPGAYPLPPRSFLLANEGGRFRDVTAQAAEALVAPGMVSDALWTDVDGDGTAELLLAGEWMPLRVFRQDAGGRFAEITDAAGLRGTGGWWTRLAAADFDGDGDVDVAAGNRGLNAQMQAGPGAPAALFADDFDDDGRVDPLLAYYIQGRRYPAAMRDELLSQLPDLARRFPDYASYADATLEDVLSRGQRAQALHLEAHTFASGLFENRGDGTFRFHPFPVEAQFAPVTGMAADDLDGDGRLDLLLAGNNFATRAQSGRYDAGQGLLLLNRGGLSFAPVAGARSGLFAPGDVRRLALVPTPAGPLLVVANNDAVLDVFSVRRLRGLGPGA